jgi:hypothetical protein
VTVRGSAYGEEPFISAISRDASPFQIEGCGVSVRIGYLRRIPREMIPKEALHLFEEDDIRPELLNEKILVEIGIAAGEEARDLGEFLLQEGQQGDGIAVADYEQLRTAGMSGKGDRAVEIVAPALNGGYLRYRFGASVAYLIWKIANRDRYSLVNVKRIVERGHEVPAGRIRVIETPGSRRK